MAKSYDDKIAELQKKIDRNKAQMKQLKVAKTREQKQAERKHRNHALIETGAVIFSDTELFFDDEERKALHSVLTKVRNYSNGGTYTLANWIAREVKNEVATNKKEDDSSSSSN